MVANWVEERDARFNRGIFLITNEGEVKGDVIAVKLLDGFKASGRFGGDFFCVGRTSSLIRSVRWVETASKFSLNRLIYLGWCSTGNSSEWVDDELDELLLVCWSVDDSFLNRLLLGLGGGDGEVGMSSIAYQSVVQREREKSE